jgi:hypothetical protein
VKPIYEVLRQALFERGWRVDLAAEPNRIGEVLEFIHPETGRAMAWLDAFDAQQRREDSGADLGPAFFSRIAARCACGRFATIVERAPPGESGDVYRCRACSPRHAKAT